MSEETVRAGDGYLAVFEAYGERVRVLETSSLVEVLSLRGTFLAWHGDQIVVRESNNDGDEPRVSMVTVRTGARQSLPSSLTAFHSVRQPGVAWIGTSGEPEHRVWWGTAQGAVRTLPETAARRLTSLAVSPSRRFAVASLTVRDNPEISPPVGVRWDLRGAEPTATLTGIEVSGDFASVSDDGRWATIANGYGDRIVKLDVRATAPRERMRDAVFYDGGAVLIGVDRGFGQWSLDAEPTWWDETISVPSHLGWAQVFPAQQLIVVRTASHRMGWDLARGELRWSHETENVVARQPPVATGDALLFASGPRPLRMNPHTGEILPNGRTFVPPTSVTFIDDDHLFVGTETGGTIWGVRDLDAHPRAGGLACQPSQLCWHVDLGARSMTVRALEPGGFEAIRGCGEAETSRVTQSRWPGFHHETAQTPVCYSHVALSTHGNFLLDWRDAHLARVDLRTHESLALPELAWSDFPALHLVSDDGSTVAAVGIAEGTMRLAVWRHDARGWVQSQIPMPPAPPNRIDGRLSPLGNRLVLGAGDRWAEVELPSGRLLRPWSRCGGSPIGIAVTENVSALAAGSEVILARPGAPVTTMEVPGATQVDIDPAGNRIAVIADHHVEVRRLDAGTPFVSLAEFDDGEWLSLASTGHFTGSAHAAEEIWAATPSIPVRRNVFRHNTPDATAVAQVIAGRRIAPVASERSCAPEASP